MEKAVNVKAKAMLQSSSGIRNIDLRCTRGNRPARKEESNCEKNKSTDSALADICGRKQSSSIKQTSSTYPKKD